MCRAHFRLLEYNKFEILKKHVLGPFPRKWSHLSYKLSYIIINCIILFSRWCVQRELQLCDGQWRSSLHTSTAHWIWRHNILHEVPLLIFLSCYKWDLLQPIGQHQCTEQLDWRTECQLPYMAVRQQYKVCVVHFCLPGSANVWTTHVGCTLPFILAEQGEGGSS